MIATSEVFSRRVAADQDGRRSPVATPTLAAPALMRGPSARFTGRLYRTIDEIAAVWVRLQARGHLTAYQRLDWSASIAMHLAQSSSRQLLFVEVIDQRVGETILLLPLGLQRRFGVSILGWLDFGVCDYAAPVVGPGLDLSADETAEVWALVLSLLPRVDLVDIRQIPAQIDGAANPLVLLPHCRETSLEAFGVTLNGDPATQIRRLLGSRNHRHFNRQINRLAERGAVRLVEPTSVAELETLFSTMVEQRRQRFRDIGRFEILNVPAVECFYRDMALRSLRDGGPAKLFGIAVGDEIVATTYMLVHGGSMHGIILSIGGSKWSAFSPGYVIAVKMIEWAAVHGLTYFDMTVGNLSYKSRLGGKARTLHRLLEPRTRRGRWAASVLLASASGSAWLQNQPRLFGALRMMRQRLRRLSNRNPER